MFMRLRTMKYLFLSTPLHHFPSYIYVVTSAPSQPQRNCAEFQTTDSQLSLVGWEPEWYANVARFRRWSVRLRNFKLLKTQTAIRATLLRSSSMGLRDW